MGLKSIFNAIKQEGYIIKKLDLYLLSLNSKDNDRAINVNSPSQASNCLRANYYARMGYENDGAIDSRARRIFDNGTKTHERLQEYMLNAGILINDEVPCINDPYQIQGHTDGYLNLGKETESKIKLKKGVLPGTKSIKKYSEVGILEIKSINSHSYGALKDAKPEHKEQAMIYLYCSEERRKYLQKTYKSEQEFYDSVSERKEEYKKYYTHLKDGSKHSKEEKIEFQLECCLNADDILFHTKRPIDKVIFLYENKDNQELKEFCVVRNNEILEEVLSRYEQLNKYVADEELPPREGTSKSCSTCRWCNFKLECFC